MQEAFTRLARAGIDRIDDPEGWLVVVTTQTVPRSASARGADARPIRWTSARIPSIRTQSTRRVRSTLVDNVTLAMHALLERLSPAERTSFVLHDVFQYTFDDIADDRRANTRRVPAAGQPGPPDPAAPNRRSAASRSTPRCNKRSASDSSRHARVAISTGCWRCSTRPSKARATSTPWSRSARPRSRRESCATWAACVADAPLPAGRRSGRHRRAARPPRARADPVDDRQRARRPRRRVGRRRSARRSERSPRPALTEPAVRAEPHPRGPA